MESESSFENKFINTPLNEADKYLFEKNNELVNSNEFYINYKMEYLNKTNENFNKYKNLLKKFTQLDNNYQINDTKYSFTFINEQEYNKINKELKDILIQQRQLYINFMNYVQFLNS